jgi:hypothetical protein
VLMANDHVASVLVLLKRRSGLPALLAFGVT